MIAPVLQVAAGGALGAAARYLLGVAATRAFGRDFPWGTLSVNVAGSLAMGILVGLIARRGGAHLHPFLAIGVLGGFTTFSSFALEAVTLWDRGQANAALGYVLGSVILSILAVVAGLALVRALP